MRNPVREVIGDAVVICEAFPRRRGWEVLCSFTRPGKQPVIASHGTWASKDAAFHTMNVMLESIREKWAKVANPNGFWPDPTYDPDDEDGDERARVRRRLRVSKMGARRNVIVDTHTLDSLTEIFLREMAKKEVPSKPIRTSSFFDSVTKRSLREALRQGRIP